MHTPPPRDVWSQHLEDYSATNPFYCLFWSFYRNIRVFLCFRYILSLYMNLYNIREGRQVIVYYAQLNSYKIHTPRTLVEQFFYLPMTSWQTIREQTSLNGKIPVPEGYIPQSRNTVLVSIVEDDGGESATHPLFTKQLGSWTFLLQQNLEKDCCMEWQSMPPRPLATHANLKTLHARMIFKRTISPPPRLIHRNCPHNKMFYS